MEPYTMLCMGIVGLLIVTSFRVRSHQIECERKWKSTLRDFKRARAGDEEKVIINGVEHEAGHATTRDTDEMRDWFEKADGFDTNEGG